MDRQGVAHGLYVEVVKFLDQHSMNKSEFSRLSGVPRPTVDRLAYGREKPRRATVDAIAKAIKMDRDEARALAGYPPPVSRQSATRQAILEDPIFDDHQRTMMLQFFDLIVGVTEPAEGEQAAPPRLPSGGSRRRREDGEVRRRAG